MNTMLTYGNPARHAGHDGCDGHEPLTLADRERMHGRSFRHYDQTRDYCAVWCERCLGDLPNGFADLFHVCEDELPPVQVDDVVRYHGSLAGYRGTIWEVTHVDERGRIRLLDVNQTLSRVHRSSVTVLRRAGDRRR